MTLSEGSQCFPQCTRGVHCHCHARMAKQRRLQGESPHFQGRCELPCGPRCRSMRAGYNGDVASRPGSEARAPWCGVRASRCRRGNCPLSADRGARAQSLRARAGGPAGVWGAARRRPRRQPLPASVRVPRCARRSAPRPHAPLWPADAGECTGKCVPLSARRAAEAQRQPSARCLVDAAIPARGDGRARAGAVTQGIRPVVYAAVHSGQVPSIMRCQPSSSSSSLNL